MSSYWIRLSKTCVLSVVCPLSSKWYWTTFLHALAKKEFCLFPKMCLSVSFVFYSYTGIPLEIFNSLLLVHIIIPILQARNWSSTKYLPYIHETCFLAKVILSCWIKLSFQETRDSSNKKFLEKPNLTKGKFSQLATLLRETLKMITDVSYQTGYLFI